MVYIDHISIERAIMHRIIGKEQNVDAHCEYNDELLSLDNEIKSKQSLRDVLRTLIKIYSFAPNFKLGTK